MMTCARFASTLICPDATLAVTVVVRSCTLFEDSAAMDDVVCETEDKDESVTKTVV